VLPVPRVSVESVEPTAESAVDADVVDPVVAVELPVVLPGAVVPPVVDVDSVDPLPSTPATRRPSLLLELRRAKVMV
jgi:hypothetical protein